MSLDLDWPAFKHRPFAIKIIVHHRIVDHKFVIQVNGHSVSNHPDAKLIPLADRPVGTVSNVALMRHPGVPRLHRGAHSSTVKGMGTLHAAAAGQWLC